MSFFLWDCGYHIRVPTTHFGGGQGYSSLTTHSKPDMGNPICS